MELTINGKPTETSAASLDGLIAELGFVRGTVLVEYNGVALRPDEWPATTLQPGDRLELLRIVAGG